MSFEAERARIETHFRDRWLASPFAGVPVLYENTSVAQPSTDFLVHRISDSDGRQMEIVGQGAAFHRFIGAVQVDILTTPGSGSANARRMADVVASAYARQTLVDGAGGLIVFRAPSFRAMGMTSERYRFIVICPFERNIRL